MSAVKIGLSGNSNGETNPLRVIGAAGNPLTGHLVSATIRNDHQQGTKRGAAGLKCNIKKVNTLTKTFIGCLT